MGNTKKSAQNGETLEKKYVMLKKEKKILNNNREIDKILVECPFIVIKRHILAENVAARERHNPFD